MRIYSNCQQTLDAGVVRFVYNYVVAQVALGFRRLFAHQVAHFGPIALNFPRTRHFESLLGAGVGLHFRHGTCIF